MLIDNIKIKVSAGSGGNGAVAFMKKGIGPTGGNGGRGGSVYIIGVSDLGALQQFRFKKEVESGWLCTDSRDDAFHIKLAPGAHNGNRQGVRTFLK